MSKAVSIQLFKAMDGPLRPLWRELEIRAQPYVFQRYLWLRHWMETIGAEQSAEASIIIASREDGPHVLLPFIVVRQKGVRVLRFLGADMADYMMPIATRKGRAMLREASFWTQVFSLLPKYDVLHLERIPENPLDSGLFPFYDARAKVGDYAHGVRLPSRWEVLEERLPSGHRKNMRRQLRQLQEMDGFSFRVLEPDSEAARRLLEQSIAQKRQRYEQTGARDNLAEDAHREFYLRMPASLGGGVRTHFCALCLGDELLASSWGVIDAGRYFGLMLTFSAEYAKYSLGKVMVEALLRHCIDERLAVCDFTYGGEAYKKTWCNMEMPLYEILHPVTLQGRLYVGTLEARELLKQSPQVVEGVQFMRKQLYRLKN